MTIREVMTPGVEVIGPDRPLREAAKRMATLNVGSIPVCDGDRLVGVITDRDITVRATAAGRDPISTHVSDVMTPGITYCTEDEDVEKAAEVMEKRQIRRLPVLNSEKRLVGIVSLGDLAVRTKSTSLAGEALERVSEPRHTGGIGEIGYYGNF